MLLWWQLCPLQRGIAEGAGLGSEGLFLRNGDCINNTAKGQCENEEGGILWQHLWLEKDCVSCLPFVSYYAVKLQIQFLNVSWKEEEMQSRHMLCISLVWGSGVVRQSWTWAVCCPASGWHSCLHIFRKICQLMCDALPKFCYGLWIISVWHWHCFGSLGNLQISSGCLLLSSGLKVILLGLEVCQLLFKESKPFR